MEVMNLQLFGGRGSNGGNSASSKGSKATTETKSVSKTYTENKEWLQRLRSMIDEDKKVKTFDEYILRRNFYKGDFEAKTKAEAVDFLMENYTGYTKDKATAKVNSTLADLRKEKDYQEDFKMAKQDKIYAGNNLQTLKKLEKEGYIKLGSGKRKIPGHGSVYEIELLKKSYK